MSGALAILAIVVVTLLGVAGAGHRVRRRTRVRSDDDVPLLLDLVASVLESGAPVSKALCTVGDLAESAAGVDVRTREAGTILSRVGRMLDLGAPPAEAWTVAEAHPSLALVAAHGVRCADSGARLAGALRVSARVLREARRQAAEARAQRVGVWTMLPLGLCFLPAFVCLGVAPALMGLGRQALSR